MFVSNKRPKLSVHTDHLRLDRDKRNLASGLASRSVVCPLHAGNVSLVDLQRTNDDMYIEVALARLERY